MRRNDLKVGTCVITNTMTRFGIVIGHAPLTGTRRDGWQTVIPDNAPDWVTHIRPAGAPIPVTTFGSNNDPDVSYPIIALFDGPVDQPTISPSSRFGAVINAATVTAWDPALLDEAVRAHRWRLLNRLETVESGEMTFLCTAVTDWRFTTRDRLVPNLNLDLTIDDLAVNEPVRFVRADPDNDLRWVMAGTRTGIEITVPVETVICDAHQHQYRTITGNTVTEATVGWREQAETVLRSIARTVGVNPTSVSSDGQTVNIPWPVLEALLVGQANSEQIGALIETAMVVADHLAPSEIGNRP